MWGGGTVDFTFSAAQKNFLGYLKNLVDTGFLRAELPHPGSFPSGSPLSPGCHDMYIHIVRQGRDVGGYQFLLPLIRHRGRTLSLVTTFEEAMRWQES